MSIELKQFKEFRESYRFVLEHELYLLKHIENKTFNPRLRRDVKEATLRIINNHRPRRDRELTILLEYTLYLSNFMKNTPCVNDRVYDYLTTNNNKNSYISFETLKEIQRNMSYNITV